MKFWINWSDLAIERRGYGDWSIQIFALRCAVCRALTLGCRHDWFCGLCESCRLRCEPDEDWDDAA